MSKDKEIFEETLEKGASLLPIELKVKNFSCWINSIDQNLEQVFYIVDGERVVAEIRTPIGRAPLKNRILVGLGVNLEIEGYQSRIAELEERCKHLGSLNSDFSCALDESRELRLKDMKDMLALSITKRYE